MSMGDKVMTGTHGELWLAGEYVAEVVSFEAKLEIEIDEFALAGHVGTATRFLGTKGTGSVKLAKMNSRMIKLLANDIQRGIWPAIQILASLDDPNVHGAERILIEDAKFTELTLAGWTAKERIETDYPFVFTKWKPLDLIQ